MIYNQSQILVLLKMHNYIAKVYKNQYIGKHKFKMVALQRQESEGETFGQGHIELQKD